MALRADGARSLGTALRFLTAFGMRLELQRRSGVDQRGIDEC